MPQRIYFKAIPAVYLMLIKDGKILLSRRYNTGFCDGQYGFPAGHLEGNETLREAMVRETKEEIGVDIKTEDLEMVHIIDRKAADGERLDFFFTLEKWQGEPEIKEPHKCDDLSWFDLKNLPDNTILYIGRAINCFLNKQIYSEFGW